MSDRAKSSTLTRRAVAVRGVVEALVNETISDGNPVDADKVARLGLLAFEDGQPPADEPLLAKPELERFVRMLVADRAAH